jgi:hypothetical protein
MGSPPPSAATVRRLKERYGDRYLVITSFPSLDYRGVNPAESAPTKKPEPLPTPESEAAVSTTVPEPATVPVIAPAAAPPAFAEPSPAESTQASASTPRKALVLVSDGHVVPPSSPDVKSDAFKTATGTVDASLKAFAPLILTTLPPAIQRTLSWMRKGKEEAIARDASLAPSPEMGHDLRLLRFLIGHKFDPHKALDEYIAALKKRRNLNVDALRDEIVGANADFFERGGSALAQIHFHPKSATVEKKMPRMHVQPRPHGGPYPLLLHRDGHAIEVNEAPDLEKIGALGTDDWDAAERAFSELQVLVIDELSHRDGVLRMVCKVTDVLNREGALAKSLVPNPFAGAAEKQFKETGSQMKALYPTVVFKWFMVNLRTNYKSSVQKAIANFGGRSKHKMIVCDTEFEAVLFVDVDPSQLPTHLKGSLEE